MSTSHFREFREARRKAGYSSQYFAKLLDVSPKTLFEFEEGRGSISVKAVQIATVILDLPARWPFTKRTQVG